MRYWRGQVVKFHISNVAQTYERAPEHKAGVGSTLANCLLPINQKMAPDRFFFNLCDVLLRLFRAIGFKPHAKSKLNAGSFVSIPLWSIHTKRYIQSSSRFCAEKMKSWCSSLKFVYCKVNTLNHTGKRFCIEKTKSQLSFCVSHHLSADDGFTTDYNWRCLHINFKLIAVQNNNSAVID